MARTSGFVILALVAGLIIGFFARDLKPERRLRSDARTKDLAAIEKLHQADVEVTLPQDPDALTELFSDNAVNLVFPTPAVGKKAIHEGFQKFRVENPDFRVLKYAADIKEVQVVDDWAIEVGYFEATYKLSAKGDPVHFPRAPGMRVLKRQSDGSWKFALVGLK
jgi:ketosteroid isomerase-like protein